MEILNKEETLNYVGGAKISLGVVAFFGALGSFILGFIEGFTNPVSCNK